MSSTLILQIPEPCNEGWHNMTPTEKGRHCHSCSRELIDFTRWSDSRLAAYLESNNGKLCRRFSSRQLNRNLLPAMQTAPSYNGLTLPALVLLAITMTSGGAFAAERTDPAPAFSLLDLAEEMPKDTIRPTYRYRGTVSDKITGETVPFAVVCVATANEKITAQTDLDGVFELTIPAEAMTFQLTIAATGYEPITVAVNAGRESLSNRFEIGQEEFMLEGDVIITQANPRKERRAERKAEKVHRRTKTD
jgi:hypothetical protein